MPKDDRILFNPSIPSEMFEWKNYLEEKTQLAMGLFPLAMDSLVGNKKGSRTACGYGHHLDHSLVRQQEYFNKIHNSMLEFLKINILSVSKKLRNVATWEYIQKYVVQGFVRSRRMCGVRRPWMRRYGA